MGIYKREIGQLEQTLTLLKQSRTKLKNAINSVTDPEMLRIYKEEEQKLIDDIDEVEQAIEILRNKEAGTKNGFDEHAEEVDWTNPANWPDIRKLFGFDANDN